MRIISKSILKFMMVLLAIVLFWSKSEENIVYAVLQEQREIYNEETQSNLCREYIVSKDGSGDFITIQAAVDNAKDGDTLIIYPGVYYENVRVLGKELNIIGINKDECMIEYDTASYVCVPLEIAAGKVSNLTIYGVHIREDGPLPEEVEQVISRYGEEFAMEYLKNNKGYSGYAVHAEQDFSYGKELKFENCRIVSANSACVGIGSRGNSKIIFENCELLSWGGTCIFLHDSPIPELGGETYFSLHNCYCLQMNHLGPAMIFRQMLDCNNYIFNFQNVTMCIPDNTPVNAILQINNYSDNAKDGWCGLHNTILTPNSYGNTIDVMNWNADS